MLNQKLQQKLLQKLSPQQIMLMKLLQIPSVNLEQRIKEEIEANPVLEEGKEKTEEELEQQELQTQEEEFDKEANEEFDLEDYLSDDDIPEYRLHTNNQRSDEEQKEVPYASGKTFHENLLQQLRLRILSEKELIIATTIIGNLDDSGYLQRETDALADDLLFTQNMEVSEEEVIQVLSIIQELEPLGVGARNLQECLMIQLKSIPNPTQETRLAIDVIGKYFNDFTKKHYDKIMKKTGTDEEELKAAIDEVLKLNPKPGNSMNETIKVNHYIQPDFLITINEGKPELHINAKNTPDLRISKSYQEMLRSYAANPSAQSRDQKDAVTFIKQKIDSAKWFIDAIQQRRNTLFTTMSAIMEYQKEYLLTGDETKLRPMILKDIADIVQLDISTISRVANSKYVQTPYGTFLLKSFFSESMQTDAGEEVSTREIKKILQDCIDAENKTKPLTDEHLAGILKEKGYNIARRTVAKYREQLHIPVARLRKEL
ncbi:MAG: RNA polymerase sigma-54 factor [Bacteroidetes bacterium]|nr:MAG: RNA polymerase sigma-54 factor [Bacteroidota bacterium]